MKKSNILFIILAFLLTGCSASSSSLLTPEELDQYFAEAQAGKNTLHATITGRTFDAEFDPAHSFIGSETAFDDGVYFVISTSNYTYFKRGNTLFQLINPVIPLDGKLRDIVSDKEGFLRHNYQIAGGNGEALLLTLKDGKGAEKLERRDLSFDPNDDSLNIKGRYRITAGEIVIDSVEKDDRGKDLASGAYSAVYELLACENTIMDIQLQGQKTDPFCNLLPKKIEIEGGFRDKLIKKP